VNFKECEEISSTGKCFFNSLDVK